MWSRAELKKRAKKVMGRSYWKMFLVSLVAIVLSGELFSATKRFSTTSSTVTNGISSNNMNLINEFISLVMPVVLVFSAFAFVGILIGYCYSFFIARPIQVGKYRYYFRNTEEKAEFSLLFSTFGANYLNVVKIMFVKDVKQILWTLLLIIPGIVKRYEYQMIPYILAEDPGIDMQEAFYRSKQMTQNQKFDMFFLDLSFLGWNILGMLLFGIGTLFVLPYEESVGAELYIELKKLSNESPEE